MAVSRITIVNSLPGHENEAQRLLQELVDFYSKQAGYVAGYAFKFHPSHTDRKQNMGRISVWESKEAADKAAISTHSAALRSQLNQHVGQSHDEWLVDITGTPAGLNVKGAAKR